MVGMKMMKQKELCNLFPQHYEVGDNSGERTTASPQKYKVNVKNE